jgi:transposase-like protein
VSGSKQTRRRFTAEYKEQAVARLSEPGATHSGVAAELGVTATQLKTWRLELEAAGSASAIERQQAEAVELAQLRRDNKRLKEEVEVLRKASAFLLSGRRRHEREARLHRRPRLRSCRPADVQSARRRS